MKIRKFEVISANLNPRYGAESGKTRPVVVVQTDLLNDGHPSTIVCLITTQIQPDSKILRIHLAPGETGLKRESDVLVDQIRAIDNRRLKKHIGKLSDRHQNELLDSLKILILQ